MTDIQAATARVAVAELEARRLRERSETQARRWRTGLSLFRVLLAIGAAVYLQFSHWQISGAHVLGLLAIYLAAQVWAEHRMREEIRTLQAEVDRLKDESQRKFA